MKAIKNVEDMSRKSMLAGMGAYSEGVEKSTDKLDKFYVEGNAFVQSLIERGEIVEAEIKTKLQGKFKGKEMLEDKIAMLKAKLGMQNDVRDIQLEKLSAKVDNLIDVVAKLAQQKAAEVPAKKPATRRASTAKTAAKSTDTAKPVSKTATKSTTTKAKATTTATKAPAKPRTRKAPAKAPTKATAAKPSGASEE